MGKAVYILVWDDTCDHTSGIEGVYDLLSDAEAAMNSYNATTCSLIYSVEEHWVK